MENIQSNCQVVDARVFDGKLSSNDDWYRFLKFHQGYLLPQYKNTSMRFIKDFLQGYKQLLKNSDVQNFNVPHYPELRIQNILEQVKSDVNIMRHLNYYPESKRLPEREFFFKVIGTIAPDYLKKLIQQQNKIRNNQNVQNDNNQAIAIKDEIYLAIQQEPYFSRNKGKGISMLKVTSKSRSQQQKKRKFYELQVKYDQIEEEKSDVKGDTSMNMMISQSPKRKQFNI